MTDDDLWQLYTRHERGPWSVCEKHDILAVMRRAAEAETKTEAQRVLLLAGWPVGNWVRRIRDAARKAVRR